MPVVEFSNPNALLHIQELTVAPRTSKTKIIDHRLGKIGYKVFKVARDIVSIRLTSPLDVSRLRERGADLTLLENIGGRRARKVMIQVLASMDRG